jgi:molecular chaperone DnaJ
MALKYHPDKNPAENAAEMFRRAKDAHDVLINEQSRAAYDSRRRGGGR